MVPSAETCMELYAATGIDPGDEYFDKGSARTFIPVYKLDFMLQFMLPQSVPFMYVRGSRKVSPALVLRRNVRNWLVGYATTTFQCGDETNPAEATAQLCIALAKEGLLEKEKIT